MSGKTKAQLQREVDELVAVVKRQHRLAEQHENEHEELDIMRAQLRAMALNLSKGNWRMPEETLVRMYQAQDELARIRHILADVALEGSGSQPLVSAFAQGLLSGHLRAPAMRVTDPNNPL